MKVSGQNSDNDEDEPEYENLSSHRSMKNMGVKADISVETHLTPSSSIPVAPPPPPPAPAPYSGHNRLMPGRGSGANTRSVYDNFSEDDSYDLDTSTSSAQDEM